MKVIAVLQFIFAALKKLVTRKSISEISGPSSATSSPALRPEDEQKLSQLYPPFAQVVRQFVLEANRQGMAVGIFEGLRTVERQAELYAKGRDANGKIVNQLLVVTNAPPGLSAHNYGCACDLVFDGCPAQPGWQWSWADKFPWGKLAELGKSFGLDASYFWETLPESPHFQNMYGFRYHALLAVYQKDGLSAVWSALDKAQLKG